MKKKIPLILAAALMASSACACHKEKIVTVEPGTNTNKVVAKETDAILAVIDESWSTRFLGNSDDLLYPNAGIAHITGDGDYTVSVDAAGTDISPKGLNFLYVKVFDGYGHYPNMAIEVKSVRVDGKELELKAKNYTSSEDKREMRATIYNTYVEKLPEDAHDANGAVTDDGTYSAQIIDPEAFASGWTKVEVDFTVTGTAQGS
ncbi:MAG: hypothetical protein IJM44_03155 [Ruminococcus sp.]|nr:hypothetical protein [Ruminococcus sp.]